MIHENYIKLEFQYPLSNILWEKGQAHLLQLSMAAVSATWAQLIRFKEAIWATKLKIFTIWLSAGQKLPTAGLEEILISADRWCWVKSTLQ